MREPTKVAQELVTVGRGNVGWYVSLANRASKGEATHWNVMCCDCEARARGHARVIRRVVADGIRDSRKRA